MITEDNLFAAGYKRYTDSFSNADWFYQKRILDVNGNTDYFINLYYYKVPLISWELRTMWELRMSFERDDPLFDYMHIKAHVHEERMVEEVEALAMKIFIANDGKAYD